MNDEFDELINNSKQYVQKDLGYQFQRNIFTLALQEALSDITYFTGIPEHITKYLDLQEKKYLNTLGWLNKWLSEKAVKLAYQLVNDVYISVHKRFIQGGEGEGWIDFTKINLTR